MNGLALSVISWQLAVKAKISLCRSGTTRQKFIARGRAWLAGSALPT